MYSILVVFWDASRKGSFDDPLSDERWEFVLIIFAVGKLQTIPYNEKKKVAHHGT
jgi:hypothetical protein